MVTGGWCRWHCFNQKKGAYLFKSRFFCKTSQPSFSDSPFKGTPFQNLGKSSKKHGKSGAILILSHFQMHRKIPTACFPSTQSVLCWPRVQPCFSWSNLPIHPGRSWKPSWKSRSVAKRTRPKACGWEGGFGKCCGQIRTHHPEIMRMWGWVKLYIYMYNIHIYIYIYIYTLWIQTLSEKVHT